MARTKQIARKRKRGEDPSSQGNGMEIIDLTSPTDGKEILNRKQKMRKLFRQQQKVIRQLEKKCQNPSSEEALLAQSDGSVPLESSSAVPLSQMGVEERKALIDAATKEAVVTRLLHLFPSNKDKVCHTAPFISKSDHHRQVVRVKKQLGKMPFQALKTDVCWLSSEGVSSRSRSVEGMTLAEELLKFADYVALSQEERSSRQRLLKELSDVVLSKFPAASVTAFGSYSADLSIFLSDLDVSIHFPQSPPTSLPPALPPNSSSITTSAESRPLTQAPNQHIYLDQSDHSDRDEGAAKTETKTEDDDVICWTIDTQLGGKNALSSPTHRIESEKEKDGADLYCFDESDFIRQEEVSLHYDVSATSSEEERSDAAGAVTIDDFDDDDDDNDDDSSKEDEVEEDEEEVAVAEEGSDVEVEEDLDIQVIGLPSHTSEERRSLHASEMEFSNAFQFDSDDGEYVSATVSAERAEKQRATKERDVIVGKLKSLMPVLKAMDWSDKIEFRSRAKVPIINLFHLNGVECDVSIGQAAKDTSELVAALKAKTGPALFVLSAFLKVFLGQLDLDKPFTGGLGSFKLYLMIARHVSDFYPNYQRQLPVTPSEHTSALVYGEMLLSFLQFYGNPLNLNEHSDVAFDGVSVSFSNTRLARELQTSFRTAHDILIAASQQRLALLKQRWRQRQQGQQSWEEDDASNEYSLSLLGTVIDAARLRQQRSQHQRQCDLFPLRSEPLTDALVSQQLLPHLLDRLDLEPAALTLQQLETVNTSLALRLRSFDSLERLTQALSSEQQRQQRQRRTQQVASAVSSASSALTSTYSFNHYGVVGQSVAQAMMSREGGALSQSKRKMKQRKKRKSSLTSSSYEEGRDDDYWEEEEVEERRRKVRRYDSQQREYSEREGLPQPQTTARNDMSDKINQLRHSINVYKEKLHSLNSYKLVVTCAYCALFKPQFPLYTLWLSEIKIDHCKYETIQVTIPATEVLLSRQLPQIITRLSHPEDQVHLKVNVSALKEAHCENLVEFVAWFICSTPARSLTWTHCTDIIDRIPVAYEIFSRVEQLSLRGGGSTIDLSRLSENNRLRVLTLDDVEFLPFGCTSNLRGLKELHVSNVWVIDGFLQPSPDVTSTSVSKKSKYKYKYKDKKSHPFAEYEFPGLKKVSFTTCKSRFVDFNPMKFSHVSDVTFESSGTPLLSSLSNLSSLVLGSPGVPSFAEFDKLLTQSCPLTRFKVKGVDIDNKILSTLALDRKIRHLKVGNYLSKAVPLIPSLRCLALVGSRKLFNCQNLEHLFSVEIVSCRDLRSLEGLSRVPVVSVIHCWELTHLEDLRSDKCNRSITIEYLPKVRDFSPLNNVRTVSITRCQGFRNCSDVSGVRDLTLRDCEGLESISSALRNCQSLTLLGMSHLSSLVEVMDIKEITFGYFRTNKLLYGLGGDRNQKIVFFEGDIPDDLPYLDQYLRFERNNEKIVWRILLKRSSI